MSVDDAALAVLAFAPTKVYPYHYRQPDGLADVAKFKTLVNTGNPSIEVVLLEWYQP
jgi:L-ascorbate metabolism protein UlaG (beta-lactamase superfamily)